MDKSRWIKKRLQQSEIGKSPRIKGNYKHSWICISIKNSSKICKGVNTIDASHWNKNGNGKQNKKSVPMD